MRKKESLEEIQRRNEILGLDTSKMDRFVGGFTVTFKTAVVFLIMIGILTMIIVGFALFILWSPAISLKKDALKYLQEIYRGEKFTIIEQDTDEDGNGWYLLSPKSNPEIQFQAYQDKDGVKDDYYANAYQYYMEHHPNQEWIAKFEVKSSQEKEFGKSFLKYEVYRNFSGYEEIEQAVKDINDLMIYLEEQDKRCYFYATLTDGKAYTSARCHERKNYEEFLYEAQYQYINYYQKENNIIGIPPEEIARVWKPEYLDIYVNGQAIGRITQDAFGKEIVEVQKAIYQLADRRYEFYISKSFLKKIDAIEIIKESRGKIKISYQGKEYIIREDGKKDKKNIPANCSLENLKQYFGAEIRCDEENQKVWIEIK